MVEVVARAFEEPGHDLSHEHVTFAELDREVVGMLLDWSAEDHRRSTRAPLRRAAGRLRLRMRLLTPCLAPLFRVLDDLEEGDHYLQALAVDEAHGGRGIGSALLDEGERHAVASGARRLVLDVATRNAGARHLYERRGMTVASRWPRRGPFAGRGFVRMVRDLSPGPVQGPHA